MGSFWGIGGHFLALRAGVYGGTRQQSGLASAWPFRSCVEPAVEQLDDRRIGIGLVVAHGRLPTVEACDIEHDRNA